MPLRADARFNRRFHASSRRTKASLVRRGTAWPGSCGYRAVVGGARRVWQPLERDDSLHSSRIAEAQNHDGGRVRPGRSVRAGVQRGALAFAMELTMDRRVLAGALMAGLLLGGFTLSPAEPVAVRYAEGLVHGFLALRTLD